MLNVDNFDKIYKGVARGYI